MDRTIYEPLLKEQYKYVTIEKDPLWAAIIKHGLIWTPVKKKR